MGTDCAPLVADLFLFYYERDFMLSLSEDTQSDVIEAFNSTSRYLDDLLNIYNNFFDSMVNRIYLKQKASVASFPPLHGKNSRQDCDCYRGVYVYFIIIFDKKKRRYTV